MDFVNGLILFIGALLLLSILAGVLSNRIGAPLLLVFLGLGMLLGEEGMGGVRFDDFSTGFTIASVALVIILFDGGFRTPMRSVRAGWAPALSLATIGVVVTALVTAFFAVLVVEGGWLRAFLIGAIVASTDAAAVFLLLHQRGMALKRRLGSTLEIESGANDPMAIFLTIVVVELLRSGQGDLSLDVLRLFLEQLVLGALLGLAGGKALGWTVNRLELASGLYPVFVVAAALFIFGLTQEVGGSGFLAAYLAGILSGNSRLRASKLIRRFHDGLAWVSQIVMFVMLGLLVTPSNLMDGFLSAMLIAVVLIFVARPLAVFVSLLPFRFTRAERVFVAWVGLRGAVPIYLAMIPVLGGLPDSMYYFNVAFLVVLTSLVMQGWTVPWLARRLNLELPPEPEPMGKIDLYLPSQIERDVVAYHVTEGSPACGKAMGRMHLPDRTRILSVLREDQVIPYDADKALALGDTVLLICPPEHSFHLDRLFAPPSAEGGALGGVLGDFEFPGTAVLGRLSDEYGFVVEEADRNRTLSDILRIRLGRDAAEGDSLSFGAVDLVIRETEDGRITRVGLRLEPEQSPELLDRATALLHRARAKGRDALVRLARRIGRRDR